MIPKTCFLASPKREDEVQSGARMPKRSGSGSRSLSLISFWLQPSSLHLQIVDLDLVHPLTQGLSMPPNPFETCKRSTKGPGFQISDKTSGDQTDPWIFFQKSMSIDFTLRRLPFDLSVAQEVYG